MIKKLLLCLLLSVTLTGCKKEVTVTDTKYFEVPMQDDAVCRIKIPEQWGILEQDAFHYWKINDDTTVYKTVVPSNVGKKDGECTYTSTAVSRNFEGGTITINTSKDMVPFMTKMLNEAELVNREVKQYKELTTDKLPDYVDLPMSMTNNGLYMPTECEDVLSLAFTAANTIEGSSFVGSWLMNAKINDLKPLLHNIVTCNTEDARLTSWFESDDCYYAVSGNKVVAAKKLTFNQWYCYVASLDDYASYVTKAMLNIDNIK